MIRRARGYDPEVVQSFRGKSGEGVTGCGLPTEHTALARELTSVDPSGRLGQLWAALTDSARECRERNDINAGLVALSLRGIEQALRINNWNRQTTAQLLEINRTTLYKKMKRYELESDPLRAG